MATSPTQLSLKLDINEQVTAASHDQGDWGRRVAAWSPEERAAREKKFVRRIDLRLLPILVSTFNSSKIDVTDTSLKILVYILNYIDRNALPQARIQGLEADLGLKGVQYNVCLSILFVGYIVMQSTLPRQSLYISMI
jgi:hypothetical protein